MNTESMVERPTVTEDSNVFQNIIGVFTSPAKTFARIDAKPSWILPLIIISVVNLIFIYFAGNVILNETLQQQEQTMMERGTDQETIDQTLEATEKFMAGPFMYVTTLAFPLIIIVIVAGVFLFVGNVVLGGASTFKKVFSVTCWSWLILTAYGLILLPLIVSQKTMLVNFSLAAFLPDDQRNSFLYQLFTRIDVFYGWWIAVYSIGLAVIYKMKTQKTAIAVTAVYAIYAVVASALSGLFS